MQRHCVVLSHQKGQTGAKYVLGNPSDISQGLNVKYIGGRHAYVFCHDYRCKVDVT